MTSSDAGALVPALREAIERMECLLTRGDFDAADAKITRAAIKRWKAALLPAPELALVPALRALIEAAKLVTKAREFQCIRRDHAEDGEIVYQLFADTDVPDDGINIGWIHSTRHDAEFIALALESAPQLAALLHAAETLPFDMLAHLQRQREFSERTFGPGARTKGVVDHIRKELLEIEAKPSDLSEWIDVVILALDGAWRAGHSPDAIVSALVAKQARNEARDWPDWRTADPEKAIEHVRAEPPPSPETAAETLIAALASYRSSNLELPLDGTTQRRLFQHLAPLVARWRDDLRIAHNQVAALLEQREHSEATCARLEAERDNYRTLAGIGVWHTTCRPNREMAARELQKSQAVIDKLADTITRLEADLAAVREALSDASTELWATYGDAKRLRPLFEKIDALAAAPSAPQGEFKHGRDCPKVPHTGRGHLHAADEDGPYDVDGVTYCGRCHVWLGPSAPQGEEKKP